MSKYMGNASKQSMKANYGRGPVRGNMDIESGEEMGEEHAKRAPASVPDRHAKSAPGMPPYRGVGGTKRPAGKHCERVNMGRGPTKGNQQ